MLSILLVVHYSILILLAGEIIFVSNKKPSLVQRDLNLLLITMLITILAYTLEMQCVTRDAAKLAVKFGYLGKPLILYFMFFFVLDYSGIRIVHVVRNILFATEVFVISAVLSFERHRLFYTTVHFVHTGMYPHLEKEHGPLYNANNVLIIFYVIGIVFVCARQVFIKKERKEKRAFFLLMTMPIFGMIGLVLYSTKLTQGYDATILAYCFASVGFLLIFRNYNVFEPVNLAWENVMQYIKAGLSVYDHFGNLVYMNPKAKELNLGSEVDQLYQSHEYIFHDNLVYRVEKLPIDNNGINYGFAYFISNETDNYHYAQRLKEEKQRADDASQAKTMFLSRMSHDIRTPMNAILGMSQIARLHLDDKDRVTECLSKIDISGNHLLELINEVLDMNKIESGKLELIEGDFDLLELIEEIEIMSKPLVDGKNHSFNIDTFGVNHSWVRGDRSRLSQVIMNLLSNAVKYTETGGQIELSVEEMAMVGDRYDFCIVLRDNGIGMSEDYLPILFEPFSRARDERINKIQGTGLGMSISKQFVELMDGTIEVSSALGEGSEFVVHVLLAPGNEESRYREKRNATHISQMNFDGRRILVAEDNEINAEIVGEVLSMAGLVVEFAKDGSQAVEMIDSVEDDYFDLVLMDIQMPKMNGYEATRAIRSRDREYAKKVPIIAFSANAFAEDINEALNSGMNGHLMKPIEYNKLYDVLCENIKK